MSKKVILEVELYSFEDEHLFNFNHFHSHKLYFILSCFIIRFYNPMSPIQGIIRPNRTDVE
jgi:hypothetical protein